MIGYKLIKEHRWKDVNQKIQKLNDDIASAIKFVHEIERGNLEASIGTTDSGLRDSLVSMRDQMKKYSLLEKQRNWVNEGLAKFIQILRSGNNDKKHLADSILRNLVDYLKANQGVLLALNDENPKDRFLEMEACYAYNRKKFFQKRIELGEGPAGQAVLEKSTVYLTNIPKNFIKITSGLGEALPRNLLIVPLKLDEEVFGVIELASFQIFQPHEIEFVERLGESIASAIAAVKGTERTTTLLRETKLQAEQLKAQEEEVRQNMEELSATQEAMQRAMTDLEVKEAYASELLNATDDLIYTVDKDFRFVTWNKAFTKLMESLNLSLEKGMNAFEWLPDYRSSLIPSWTRALNGETFQFQWEGERDGQKDHYLAIYAPVRLKTGEIQEAVVFAKNVAQLVEAQQQSAQLLKEAQHQAEELKAQEEELRQNMEELSATQETMEQKTREVAAREDYMTQLLNASRTVVFTVDVDFKLATWNDAFAETLAGLGVCPQKGMIAFEWRPDEERRHFVDLFKRVFKGETFETSTESNFDGKSHVFLSTFSPLRNKASEIIEAAVFAKDVTSIGSINKAPSGSLEDGRAGEQSEYTNG